MTIIAKYGSLEFFAEKSSARKGARLAGTVVGVLRTSRNGTCFACVGVPRGQVGAVPCATWVSPRYLERHCAPITEMDARALDPSFFEALEKHDADPMFRVSHTSAIRDAFPVRYSMQPIGIEVRGSHDVGDNFRRIYGE